MQFTGQKAEQPASTACLLARKCNRLARKIAANMRNAICVRTQTSKVPTKDILLVSSLFCASASRPPLQIGVYLVKMLGPLYMRGGTRRLLGQDVYRDRTFIVSHLYELFVGGTMRIFWCWMPSSTYFT